LPNAGQHGHNGQEDHDGAVHCDQLVVELGQHVAARRVVFANEGGKDWRQRRGGHANCHRMTIINRNRRAEKIEK
jgi:hypothetical protein